MGSGGSAAAGGKYRAGADPQPAGAAVVGAAPTSASSGSSLRQGKAAKNAAKSSAMKTAAGSGPLSRVRGAMATPASGGPLAAASGASYRAKRRPSGEAPVTTASAAEAPAHTEAGAVDDDVDRAVPPSIAPVAIPPRRKWSKSHGPLPPLSLPQAGRRLPQVEPEALRNKSVVAKMAADYWKQENRGSPRLLPAHQNALGAAAAAAAAAAAPTAAAGTTATSRIPTASSHVSTSAAGLSSRESISSSS